MSAAASPDRAQRVAIVGAGLAGLSLAARLAAPAVRERFRVTLVDKGRAPGGRCATRAVPGAGRFDHGAGAGGVQPRGAAFERAVAAVPPPGTGGGMRDWACALAVPGGVAALAPMGVRLHAGTAVAAIEPVPAAGDGRWWLRLAADDAAGSADAPRLGPFDTVAVAVPAEQARTLLQPHPPLARALQAVASDPCWTVMAAWPADLPRPDRLARATGPDDPLGVVRAAAQGDDRHWVLQATAAWSRDRIEASPESVRDRLLAALAARAGSSLARPSWAQAHRWRYAQVVSPLAQACAWAADVGLACIGDAWQGGAPDGAGGLERAWCSAQALADAWTSGPTVAEAR